MASQADDKSSLCEESTNEHIDHRKRRRNRTTLSCLNCHGSKRMCDRKRPACSRCTKLGLSGTCVYEVDDLNRRDASHDEIVLLKNRVAELEGFIREYKKKPHPRTTIRRKPSISAASTSPSSESGTDTESFSELKYSTSTAPAIETSRNESASESDNDSRTPSVQENEPVFLRSAGPSLSSSSLSSHQRVCTEHSSDPGKAVSSAMDIDSSFNFTSSDFFSDDPETLERIFSRIIEQEARELYASRDCQCVKSSSALAAFLELAPHLGRALNALRSVPEHHAHMSEFGSPCYYLMQMQSLTDAISSIVDSSSGAPASTSACTTNSQRSPTIAAPSPAMNLEDSPLQRVIAARKAGRVPPPFPEAPAAQTPTATGPNRAWKGSTVQTTWEASRTALNLKPTASDNDSFMSWDSEVSSRGTWPRTISL